jgi:hypothetical protein
MRITIAFVLLFAMTGCGGEKESVSQSGKYQPPPAVDSGLGKKVLQRPSPPKK